MEQKVKKLKNILSKWVKADFEEVQKLTRKLGEGEVSEAEKKNIVEKLQKLDENFGVADDIFELFPEMGTDRNETILKI